MSIKSLQPGQTNILLGDSSGSTIKITSNQQQQALNNETQRRVSRFLTPTRDQSGSRVSKLIMSPDGKEPAFRM
jgi:hypothetical protein